VAYQSRWAWTRSSGKEWGMAGFWHMFEHVYEYGSGVSTPCRPEGRGRSGAPRLDNPSGVANFVMA